MRVGYFASLIDKIQHAYGWDDETVLNLRLARAVQIKEAIDQRQEIDHWQSLKVIEWQTRSISAMVANTVENDKARKTLVDMASSLSLTGSADTKRGKSTKKGNRTYKTVDGKVITAKELKDYSYDEIDHSEEEAERLEATRRKNAGRNLTSVMSNFTR